MSDDLRWYRAHPDLWTYRVPLRVFGVEAGRRGTVVRYADERWAFVGPVPLDDASRAELDEAGVVDTLIVPTAFHNKFVPEACRAFSESTVYLARGARTEDLPEDRTRSIEDLPAELREALEPVPFGGMRAGHEVAFVHRASGTLIVADLCMHYPEPARGLWSRGFMRLSGWTPGVRMPGLMKMMMRDRNATRETLETLIGRDLTRIVMAHGETVEQDVSAALERMVRQVAG